MSSPINVTSGVPQGSVIGPLLFLINFNDLPDYIQNNSTVKLFADDTIIYQPITNQQDSNALQEDLDALQRWESDWLMHIHPQKCQTMHITNKRNIIQSTYTIHNHNLQSTNTAKYLGIHIHITLKWNTHVNKTAPSGHLTFTSIIQLHMYNQYNYKTSNHRHADRETDIQDRQTDRHTEH